MIEIDIKSKVYTNQLGRQDEIIANFHLTLNDNEIVGLLGASGCGKTTLLNIIAGLDNNYEGSIQFNQGAARPTIGYVFQNPRLLPWRTVRENIELVFNHSIPSSNIDELLELMQLTAFQNVYPEQLSLGMSRRVAIIRAFAIHPDVLLLDEPFVSLDAESVRTIKRLLIKCWQRNQQSVLFVTHDLRDAISLADRIIFLGHKLMLLKDEVQVILSRTDRENPEAIESFRKTLLANLAG